MKQELQAYIDKIPQIVSDALPKLEKLGYNIWDINEDGLNMAEFCDCIFGQLEGQYIQSSRLSIINHCPDGYFEVPSYFEVNSYLPVGKSSFFGFIDIGTFTLFTIKYITTLTAEYKKQIKQWKKDRALSKPQEIISNIPAIKEDICAE